MPTPGSNAEARALHSCFMVSKINVSLGQRSVTFGLTACLDTLTKLGQPQASFQLGRAAKPWFSNLSMSSDKLSELFSRSGANSRNLEPYMTETFQSRFKSLPVADGPGRTWSTSCDLLSFGGMPPSRHGQIEVVICAGEEFIQ